MIGKRFTELLSVDSTNNYAMQQVQNGHAKHGDAWFAHEQTAGRGQQNKHWLSAQRENITLSVLLDMSAFNISRQFILNMLTALSIVELFNNYTTEKIKIKWPNDIFYRDRKAAGILIENSIRGNTWQFAIAGIGININQTCFNDALKNPISLKLITGKDYNVVALAKELCIIIDNNFKKLFQAKDYSIVEAYNNVLYKRNEDVQFKSVGKIFTAMVEKVDANGNLIVNDGAEKKYQSGQIEWLQ